MNIKQTLLYSVTGLATAAILVACSDNSAINAFPEPVIVTPPAPAPVSTQGDCPTVGNLEPVEVTAGQCTIGGVLNQNATLTADMTWFLEDSLQVGNNQFTASLSIEAGTQIRGSGTDHILVWPGSTILANGTEAPKAPMFLIMLL